MREYGPHTSRIVQYSRGYSWSTTTMRVEAGYRALRLAPALVFTWGMEEARISRADRRLGEAADNGPAGWGSCAAVNAAQVARTHVRGIRHWGSNAESIIWGSDAWQLYEETMTDLIHIRHQRHNQHEATGKRPRHLVSGETVINIPCCPEGP